MLQLLRRVVKKESSSSMTVRKRRIFGMKKKLTMQHKSNPDRGTAVDMLEEMDSAVLLIEFIFSIYSFQVWGVSFFR